MKKIILTLVITMMISAVAYSQTVGDVLGALKQVRSYTADFIQTTEIEGFGEDTYSGKLYIKVGDKALWDYDKPYRQFYLFDTATMRYYDSDTEQMIVQAMDPAANVFMRLMLSPADIEKDFRVSLDGDELTLIPQEELGLEKLVFIVKGDSIIGIRTKDQSGNNTSIEFKNIRKGAAIDADVFSPEVPEGTEIFEYN